MTESELLATEQVKNSIARQWNWLEQDEIEECFDYAVFNYLAIKYPSDNNRPTPQELKYDFFTCNWLSMRMKDILERAGGLSATAYKENGISISYGSSSIDPMLVAMLTRKAGVPQ